MRKAAGSAASNPAKGASMIRFPHPFSLESEMKKQWRLYIDQYGDRIGAKTVSELKEKAGPGRVFKIYHDKKDGRVVHSGYGVGHRWFTMYEPVEIEQARR